MYIKHLEHSIALNKCVSIIVVAATLVKNDFKKNLLVYFYALLGYELIESRV